MMFAGLLAKGSLDLGVIRSAADSEGIVIIFELDLRHLVFPVAPWQRARSLDGA